MDKMNKAEGKIQAVVRATEILRCFLDEPQLRITDIAQRVGLHKSTAYGLVSTLTDCGLLQKDAVSGLYSIGVEMFRLGQLYNMDGIQLIRPFLNRLMGEFQETVNYVIADGGDIIYIEKVESPHSMRISTSRGLRRPIYCTAAGKAILAFLPPAEQAAIMDGLQFVRFTQHTISDTQSLAAELQQIRACGTATDREEYELGLLCIAAPVFDAAGRPVGALSVSGPTLRITDGLHARIAARLKETADELSLKMYGRTGGRAIH